MKKVVLIQPPWEFRGDMIDYWGDRHTYLEEPLGLMYLAAYLEENSVDVSIIDMRTAAPFRRFNRLRRLGMEAAGILTLLEKHPPAVVGITVLHSTQARAAYKLSRCIKKAFPDTRIIFGGCHPTVAPLLVMRDSSVDYVAAGEGEDTLLELVQCLLGPGTKRVADIRSVYFRTDDGKICFSGIRVPCRDIDKYPFPSRHLVESNPYCRRRSEASVLTSRGCQYRCVYCSVAAVWGREWRPRTPENVLDELTLLRQRGVQHIRFLDDNITMSKERARNLFALMISEKLGLSWSTPNGVRADRLDESLLLLMKKAGCVDLRIGIESGQQGILDHVIKKQLRLEDVEKIIGTCRKIGLPVRGFFTIGYPGEMLADMEKTVVYSRELTRRGMENSSFWIVQPTLGTELYHIAAANGYLSRDYDPGEISRSRCYINTPEFRREQVEEIYNRVCGIRNE